VDSPIDVVGDEPPQKAAADIKSLKTSTTTSGSRTPAEDWELDCEICHIKGANKVLVSYVRKFVASSYLHCRTMVFHCYVVVNARSGNIYPATTTSIALKAVQSGTGTLRNSSANDVD
jgi:hypothetical protein